MFGGHAHSSDASIALPKISIFYYLVDDRILANRALNASRSAIAAAFFRSLVVMYAVPTAKTVAYKKEHAVQEPTKFR